MSSINFLPRHYVEQQARRRAQARQVALLAVLLVCLAGWFTSSRKALSDISVYAARLEEQVKEETQSEARLAALRSEQEGLQNRLTTQRELSPQVQVHHVMAILTRAMPAGSTLLNLRVSGPVPVAEPAAKEKPAGAEDARQREERLQAEARRRAAMKLQIEMIGMAPGDAQVASILGQFAQHPLFAGVKLVYCRAQQSGDLLVREFRIEMEVPLDRDFEESAPTQGVAHAN